MTPGRRRATWPWAAGLVVVALVGSAAAEPVKAIPAEALGLGWGICGRPGADAPVGEYAAMMRAIGTRAIRVPIMSGGVSAAPQLVALDAALREPGQGRPALRVTALVTAYRNDPMTTWPAQQPVVLALAAAGLLQAIEGPNEINNRSTGEGAHGPGDAADRTGPQNYPSNFLAWAQALAQFRTAHQAALTGTALIAPSIASGLPGDYRALPDVSAFVDAANMHFYAGGGRQPSFSLPPNPDIGNFAGVLAWATEAERPGGPTWLTEAGATTSGIYARDGVSQARYIANQIFDAALAGVPQVFLYQLIDGSGAAGDVEGNFGLFHRDGTPKPAALMLGRLQRLLLAGGPRPAPRPADPAVAIVSAPGGTRSLLLRRSDGAALLALWDEPQIDDGHGADPAPRPRAVVADLGSPRAYRVEDLVGPPQQAEPHPPARRVEVMLQGSPVLIELGPQADHPE